MSKLLVRSTHYWYITFLLLGFLSYSVLFEYSERSIDRKVFLDTKNITGIIKSSDPRTNILHILTIDELKFSDLKNSVYEVEIFTSSSTIVMQQNFIISDSTIIGLEPAQQLTDIHMLRRGDYITAVYRNNTSGFEAVNILRGAPMPVVGQFTPQFLELQAQVLAEQQQ